jgi:hypothetical protein
VGQDAASICPTIPTRHVLSESGKDTLHIYAHCRARGFTWILVCWNSVREPRRCTQIANGLSITSLVYDADGNVTQKTADGTTIIYVYDYANGLTALGVGELPQRTLTNGSFCVNYPSKA